jgi:glycosyltransferase involved in cell wall biosynthesis
MGHDVFEGTIPTDGNGAVIHQLNRDQYERARAKMPTAENLESCDVVLVFAPEYVAVWLNTLYGKQTWSSLKGRRVAIYGETTRREDVQFRYDIFADSYDLHYFADPEDASLMGGRHMQGFVDLEMFKPCLLQGQPGHQCDQACYLRRMAEKKYEAAFVGSLYKKRIEFLGRLLPLLPGVDFYASGVWVRDLGGECHRESAELLAKNIRQIKVHVALPSNASTMTVPRTIETMACGTFLLTNQTEDNPFRDGFHCRLYDPAKPGELADMIRYYIAHEDEREAIAQAGCEEVRRHYSVRDRLQEVLESAVSAKRLRQAAEVRPGLSVVGVPPV